VLLIGAVPQPITSAPLVVAIYVVLILMIASALASVLFRSTVYAIGAYSATMALVGLFYLLLGAPLLLFALQLLVFTTVSAALLVGLLRRTTGIDRSSETALRPDWIVGAGVATALLALLTVVLVAVTTWPVGFCCGIVVGLGPTLTNTYVVGLAVLVVIVASGALGAGLLLATSRAAPRSHRAESPAQERGPRRPRGRRT
jgi:NADH:ubiquinone oxidoreductase subunit 6 (subunit J)